jgi:hypothetical protein
LNLPGGCCLRRRKGGKGRMAVAKAFAITSLPFILAEIATGVISSWTGLLQIPPLMGLATGIDMAILLIGLTISLTRGIQRRHPEPKIVDAPQEYSR